MEDKDILHQALIAEREMLRTQFCGVVSFYYPWAFDLIENNIWERIANKVKRISLRILEPVALVIHLSDYGNVVTIHKPEGVAFDGVQSEASGWFPYYCEGGLYASCCELPSGGKLGKTWKPGRVVSQEEVNDALRSVIDPLYFGEFCILDLPKEITLEQINKRCDDLSVRTRRKGGLLWEHNGEIVHTKQGPVKPEDCSDDAMLFSFVMKRFYNRIDGPTPS